MAVRRITIDFETDAEDGFEQIPMDKYVEAIQEAMDQVEAASWGAPAVTVVLKSDGN